MSAGVIGPTRAVLGECVRALVDGALLPLRATRYALGRRRLLRAVLHDLDHPRPIETAPPALQLPRRRLTLFVSCAEASGEIHARNLVRALRAEIARLGGPPARIIGLGGEGLAAEGVELIGNPVSRAAMGAEVFASLPFYLKLVRDAAEQLQNGGIDLFLPVDSPALHVPLARIARRVGIPVVHFATPQYWAWAPWRVGGYRRAVDLGLSILPFEPPWFERHLVNTAYVGHPLLDEIPADVSSGDARATDEAPETLRNQLVILPGSRESVIGRNLPWMLRVVGLLLQRQPRLEVVLPQARPELVEVCREHLRRGGAQAQVRIETGELHASLARARAALSVSGTILIDLLAQRVPTVVIYRLSSRIGPWLSRHALTVPWFSSVNLLAGREVLPEFCFQGRGPLEEVVDALERSLTDEAYRAERRAGLDEAARRLGSPGATQRAARLALARVQRQPEEAREAT